MERRLGDINKTAKKQEFIAVNEDDLKRMHNSLEQMKRDIGSLKKKGFDTSQLDKHYENKLVLYKLFVKAQNSAILELKKSQIDAKK